ncbi:hypothetical protein MRX96_034329 [Rhipicephalus microplus]
MLQGNRRKEGEGQTGGGGVALNVQQLLPCLPPVRHAPALARVGHLRILRAAVSRPRSRPSDGEQPATARVVTARFRDRPCHWHALDAWHNLHSRHVRRITRHVAVNER